jgi:hypothetical protein
MCPLPHSARKCAETLGFPRRVALLSPIYSPIVLELRLAGAGGATIGPSPVTPSPCRDRSLAARHGGGGGGYTITADGSIAALAWAPPHPHVPHASLKYFFSKFHGRNRYQVALGDPNRTGPLPVSGFADYSRKASPGEDVSAH